jgi:hypothetical protein
LILSIGGNDALGYSGIVHFDAKTVGNALRTLNSMREIFEQNYRHALSFAAAASPKVYVCTIYDAVPGLSDELKTALAILNERILFVASGSSLPVIDLRVICKESRCYSEASSIEPSSYGGKVISDAIIAAILESEK